MLRKSRCDFAAYCAADLAAPLSIQIDWIAALRRIAEEALHRVRDNMSILTCCLVTIFYD
jgi:hypothetical protein